MEECAEDEHLLVSEVYDALGPEAGASRQVAGVTLPTHTSSRSLIFLPLFFYFASTFTFYDAGATIRKER